LAKSIENYLNRGTVDAVGQKHPVNHALSAPINRAPTATPVEAMSTAIKTNLTEQPSAFESAADFVKSLWGSAKVAAKIIGADPKLLLAQAALETNWGKNIIPLEDGKSSKNLFNIKTGDKWENDSAVFHTIEEKDGVLVKEKSRFRAYDSYQASFIDYTNFLQKNTRYSDALKNATDPSKFIRSLQNAQYATDSRYSEKVMDIYASRKFNNLFEENNLI
jgi:flagellar protein FlgJ